MRRRAKAVAALAFGLVLTSCAGPNLWTDGTSVSTGLSSHGRLRRPAKLELTGSGFTVPERWTKRGFQYGTEELVAALGRAAKTVRGASKKATLGIADLSPQRGGKSKWHSSHQSGRDVDLIFYSVDEQGKSLAPPENDMIRYDGEGKPYVRGKGTYNDPIWQQRRFDTARNWALVEALLSDATIRVQWIFVSQPLEDRLLEYATRHKKPRWLIEYARAVMYDPPDAPTHSDHFHVRIYCPRDDRFHGCVDRGVVWQHEKKAYKYGGPERYDPIAWRSLASLSAIALAPG
ncbi:Murein endopeptidase [Nannocystis exedens]|uniref:Murein endopeptidase n=1 Tax=Nannocystis exedens TaxID=54 RepID=A0A1I1TA66_9BACT|nr:penicillin-insensitive murein endopeptidase [Nannocystis exedens]PCC66687.1 penicillin-insensitive murein endopeptidase [Nannocystis exedens]SFD55475.1 Murein endopeptidase [Nannocystis exedens]